MHYVLIYYVLMYTLLGNTFRTYFSHLRASGYHRKHSTNVRFQVLTAARAIALMMEAARSSETSVNFYQTPRRNNPKDNHLHSTNVNWQVQIGFFIENECINVQYICCVESVIWYYIDIPTTWRSNIILLHVDEFSLRKTDVKKKVGADVDI
jgi:hypothetical protein